MDHYWKMGNSKVHYMQIWVSLTILLVCAYIVAQILQCTLSKEVRLLELMNFKRNRRRSDRGESRAAGNGDE